MPDRSANSQPWVVEARGSSWGAPCRAGRRRRSRKLSRLTQRAATHPWSGCLASQAGQRAEKRGSGNVGIKRLDLSVQHCRCLVFHCRCHLQLAMLQTQGRGSPAMRSWAQAEAGCCWARGGQVVVLGFGCFGAARCHREAGHFQRTGPQGSGLSLTASPRQDGQRCCKLTFRVTPQVLALCATRSRASPRP